MPHGLNALFGSASGIDLTGILPIGTDTHKAAT